MLCKQLYNDQPMSCSVATVQCTYQIATLMCMTPMLCTMPVCKSVTHLTGLEDDQEDAAPRGERREMRYDDEGLDSEDDFIDDDIGDGTQQDRPKARRQGRTAGVHNQAVQVKPEASATLAA